MNTTKFLVFLLLFTQIFNKEHKFPDDTNVINLNDNNFYDIINLN